MESTEDPGDIIARDSSPVMQKSWVTVAKQKQVLKKIRFGSLELGRKAVGEGSVGDWL